MALEDFTTYTEVDNVNNDITVNGPNSATGNTMTRVDTAYLYDDKGAAHFGVFEHDHDCKPINNTAESSYAAIWGISNTIGDAADWSATYGLGVFTWRSDTFPEFMLFEIDGASADVIDTSISLVWNTTYYCVTDRDATPIVTTIIYNEAAHLTIKDTIFGSCAATTCRYVFGIASYDTGTAGKSITFDVYNLDLNEVVPPPPPPPVPPIVDYFTLTSDCYTINLEKPSWRGEDNKLNKDLAQFQFWTDNYAVHDRHIKSQPLTLEGASTLTDTAAEVAWFAQFNHIHEIMDNHEEIAVTGLGDCMDAVYIVKDFKTSTVLNHGKYVLAWSLVLEKKRGLT